MIDEKKQIILTVKTNYVVVLWLFLKTNEGIYVSEF